MQSLPLSFGPFTLKELAALYRRDMHPRTFENMVHKIKVEFGAPEGNYFSTALVAEIYKKLGPPDCFWKEWKELQSKGLV